MPGNRVTFMAAVVRLLFGVFALTLLPAVWPGLAASAPIFVAYLAVATVIQIMIWRDVGGAPRAIVGGVVDLLLLTYIVQRVGSTESMLVSLYLLLGVLNTLVVGQRTGMSLAVGGSALYAGVLVAESLGLLPHAPDAPTRTAIAPTVTEAIVGSVMMAVMLLISTGVVGMLVKRNREREEALLRVNERLEELSRRDPLTRLFNRRELIGRLAGELEHVRRGRQLAVVMIDLDRFKAVNDQRGHQTGDAVLRSLAAALAASSRRTDVAGRYGGDEFLIILPDTDPDQAEAAAERLVEEVRAAGADHGVTASAGVAIAHADDTIATVLSRADARAYEAKDLGGDRFVMEPVAGGPDAASDAHG